ncbi:unnamed protein product [Paramecium sonneborni]|uniref:Uncharacterized protein n=1 Tax=Paramecium sonneborni TaxID=65129 RepID=A0A8S1K126_9CILI|nr:unnamed protein product [Paramecium sonneborni]
MNNYYIEILHNFAKVKTIPIDFIKNLKKDPSNLYELFQMFVQMFEEHPESPDLIILTISLSQDVPPFYQVQSLNNLTVLLFQAHLIDLAKKVAKFNLKYFQQDNPQLHIITHLNLARIYYFLQDFKKCLSITEKALINYEPYIFKEIKNTCKPKDIVLLLNGYIFYAKTVQNLQVLGFCQDLDFQQFFINGAKLGRKYLGPTHQITKLFLFSERGSNMKKSINNYVPLKKPLGKILNSQKVCYQVHQLIKTLKIGKAPLFKNVRHIERSISEAQGFKTFKRPDSVKPQSQRNEQNQVQKTQQTNIHKGSFRIQSPKLIQSQKVQPQSDLEQIIQSKIDTFMKSQSQKKQEPKIVELEKKIDELTKENKRIQNQRKEREIEIEELKDKITQLSAEASKIKFRLQEQEATQEKMKLLQQQQQQQQILQQQHQQQQQQQQQQYLQNSQISTQQQQSSDSQPAIMQERMSFGIASNQSQKIQNLQVKKQERQSTIDIHNLINGLVDTDEPKINSISMINDTDFTLDLNLTILDQMDQSKQYSINLTTDQTIVKKALIDNVLYEISCGVVQKNKELSIKISLNTKQEHSTAKIEYVEMSIIKDLIQFIDYKNVLPYTQQLKCITTFKQFIQYLIIPFISIKEDEGEQKISIYAQPQSLLNDGDKIQLCDEYCIPLLYPLEDGVFRMILNSITLDLQFDQSSLDQLFDVYGQDDYEREEVQEMIKIQDNLEKSNDTVKPKHKVYNIRSYIVKNQQKLTQFLQKLIKDLEELLYRFFNVQKFQQINKILSGTQITMPNKSQAKVQMCLIKIWDKNIFQRIIFIADNSREQCFELFLSNTFETYGPRQSKVKAMGHTQIQYDNVCQKLGLNVSNLDQGDFLLICNILCNCYTLLTFTKELDSDDQERFKENAILPVELSCECNNRMFLIFIKYHLQCLIWVYKINLQVLEYRFMMCIQILNKECFCQYQKKHGINQKSKLKENILENILYRIR